MSLFSYGLLLFSLLHKNTQRWELNNEHFQWDRDTKQKIEHVAKILDATESKMNKFKILMPPVENFSK